MTTRWATQVSFEPKLVAVSVEREALTHTLIHDGGAFSLSILDREDRAIVRKFVKPEEGGAGGSELSGFAFVERVTSAPILAQALAWVDYALRHEFDVGGHTLFSSRRGGRRWVLQGRGDTRAPHGGHPDELRRMSVGPRAAPPPSAPAPAD